MGINIHNKENKTYIVLGVSHSATSLISKALQKCGINMNPNKSEAYKEYYEDSLFLELNNKILEEAGGDIFNPPEEKDILNTKTSVKEALKKRNEEMWGFKDPRTALTIKKYLPYLEGDPYLICCFRKPDKVIESLGRRYDGIDKKYVDKVNESIISGIREFCEI